MGFLYTAGTWDFDKHSRRIYNYQHMMDIIHNDSWHSSHTHMPLKSQLVLIGSVYPFSHSFGIANFTGGPFYFLMWRGWLLTCIFLDVLKYIGCVGALLRTAFECDRGIICVTLKSDPERNAPDSLHALLRFLLPNSFTTLELGIGLLILLLLQKGVKGVMTFTT